MDKCICGAKEHNSKRFKCGTELSGMGRSNICYERQIATLTKDKERLDWIRKYNPEIHFYGFKAKYPYIINWRDDGKQLNTCERCNTASGKTFDEAIDQARGE